MVIAKCAVPGVSIAAVAMRHQLNANLLRRWVADARVAEISRPAAVEHEAPAPIAGFLPVQIDPAAPSRSTIDIELRRGAVVMKVSWPVGAARECGAWLRELLK
jgi:transposase-like protein